ncbi:cytochrome b [Neisseria weixii]
MKNQTTYNRTARYLHWGMALCYTVMFATAIAWNMNDSLKFLMNPHRAIGILLLILTLFRVIWAITHAKQPPAKSLTAKLGHAALYVLMLAVPIVGVVRQAGFAQGNQPLIDLGNAWHGVLAWALLLLVAGHIGMVAVHHAKGDKILNRMR